MATAIELLLKDENAPGESSVNLKKGIKLQKEKSVEPVYNADKTDVKIAKLIRIRFTKDNGPWAWITAANAQKMIAELRDTY